MLNGDGSEPHQRDRHRPLGVEIDKHIFVHNYKITNRCRERGNTLIELFLYNIVRN